MGTFRSIGALARAIGPCLASLVFWTFGPTSCYIAGAVALLTPFYLMVKSNKLMTDGNRNDKRYDEKMPLTEAHDENLAKAN